MRADKLQKLIPKPDVSIPIELIPIRSQSDRNALINRHLPNIIAYLKQNGYDPNRDYVGDAYKKALKVVAHKEAEYQKRFAEVTVKINKEAKMVIMESFDVIHILPYVDQRRAKWKVPIVYEEENRFGEVCVHVEATPEQILHDFFGGSYSFFDANPLLEKKEFRREIHEKLSNRIFTTAIFNSKGDSHVFEVKLVWKT